MVLYEKPGDDQTIDTTSRVINSAVQACGKKIPEVRKRQTAKYDATLCRIVRQNAI
jgi:hypothetical protein